MMVNDLFYGMSLPTIIAGTVTSVAVLFVYYAHSCFLTWEQEFSASRVERTNELCPSNQQAPAIGRYVELQSESRTVGIFETLKSSRFWVASDKIISSSLFF